MQTLLNTAEHHEGARVGGNNIKSLRYADDAFSEEKLQNILATVRTECAKKPECIVISK